VGGDGGLFFSLGSGRELGGGFRGGPPRGPFKTTGGGGGGPGILPKGGGGHFTAYNCSTARGGGQRGGAQEKE